MKIALLTTDNREPYRQYDLESPWFGTAPEALMQGFAKMPDVEVHVLSCAQRAMPSPVKLAENIFFHSLVVPKIGWLRTGYLGCVRAVRRSLREIGPDIVHGQGTERECALSAAFSGYPNVITIHGNMRLVARLNRARPFTFQWLAARLERFTIPRSDGVVCITNYTRDAVASLARKTWLLPNAVDGSFFALKHAPSPTARILCIANVDSRKNQNALIRAVDTLQPPGKLELVFFGGATRGNPYVEQFFRLLEKRPWCRYEGFAGRQVIREYMATAAGVILPSLEDNCPMAVLEAMAAGVPIAAARVGGVPDLIRSGETGLLFDPRSEEALAGAMTFLLGPPPPAMVARAQAEARKRFYPTVIAAHHLEIYREVLS